MEQGEDQFISSVGNWGKWQCRTVIITGIFCIPTSWHVLIMTFMNAKVESWCARPAELADLDVPTWKQISGQDNQTCSMVDYNWTHWKIDAEDHDVASLPLVPCTQWEYDDSVFSSTITGEYDLVCSDKYLIELAQTFYFIGMILGVFTFGVLADIFGRKRVLVVLLVAICVTGILTSLMPTFTLFAVMRVINAFFLIGIFEVNFTFVFEFAGGKWSTIVGMGMEYSWVAGWLILAVLGYLVRSWRNLMVMISVPSVLAVLLVWLVPESPRWLISKGRLEEAESILRAGAKVNGAELPADWKLHHVQKDEKQSSATILDLFKTRTMRTKIMIIYYNFFVCAFLYFGLTLNIGDLGGDVFVNFAVSGLLEIPAYGLAMVVLLKYGRRVPYSCALISSGICLLSVGLVPRGVYHKDWPAMALALLGKTCVTFSFGAIFVYAAELVPTEIRTSAIGSASFLGRIGGIIAPWVGKLSEVHPYLPVTIFGANAVLAGLCAFFLPETQGLPLPYTLEEAESLELTNVFSRRKPDEEEQEKK